jgi:hypothetical protein
LLELIFVIKRIPGVVIEPDHTRNVDAEIDRH